MNLDKKLELAHEYAIEMAKQGISLRPCKELGWKYADAMEAEYNKRKQAEDKNKREAVRKLLNDSGTFIEREGQHFDDLNTADSPQLDFQVDWSVAPDGYDWWAVDGWGAWWFDQEPKWINFEWGGYVVNKHNRSATEKAPSFNYQGDWKDSLRKRP